MLRRFTEKVGHLFGQGDIRDFPRGVWGDIARSAKKELNSFSHSLSEGPKDKEVVVMQAQDAAMVDSQVPHEQVGSAKTGDSKDGNEGAAVRSSIKRTRLHRGTK